MTGIAAADVINVFLDGAKVVVAAISDGSVAAAWSEPSVLEEQTVCDLCGHLARGTWVVGEYLAAGQPTKALDFHSAAEYFAVLSDRATPEFHRANREREARLRPDSHHELVVMLSERLTGLGDQLRSGPPDRLVAVFAGLVIRLSDYLMTRIVEQVVHLDDLARSVGHDPWPMPSADQLIVVLGAEVGLRRFGPTAMIRALYRHGFADATLPVL
jgi:hypothetical protein